MARYSSKDVFKHLRGQEARAELELFGEPIDMFLSYRAVRGAAQNWQFFSSDAPFRVPIPSEEDQRRVRQLPIETDPPVHKKYRALIEPMFRRPMRDDYIKQMDALILSEIQRCAEQDQFDAVRAFAVPVQSRALACLLGVPREQAETWIGWGTHVFHDGADPSKRGSDLDAYLQATIEAARAEDDPENFFGALHRFEIEGRALSDDEKLGIANLVFAGGRDTVINTMTFLLAYFAEHPNALQTVAESPRAINLAVEEAVRIVSPLTQIGRVCTKATDKPDQRVSLCWAAANYDPEVFKAPEHIDLGRSPNPHVGFGSGHHACLGAAQARAIFRSLIRVLSHTETKIRMVEADPKIERIGPIERQVGFERLVMAFE